MHASTNDDNPAMERQRIVQLLRQAASLLKECELWNARPSRAGSIPAWPSTIPAHVLEQQADELERATFRALFVGDFKNGKSTLVNAILGVGLLPVRAVPTTAVPTMITFGTAQQAVVHDVSGGTRVIPTEEFFDEFSISFEHDGSRSAGFRSVHHAVVESPSPVLEQGLALIDSPGLSEILLRSSVIFELVSTADVVVVVLNALQLLGMDEREFLRRIMVLTKPSGILYALNRVNLVEQEDLDRILDMLRSNVETLHREVYGSFDESEFRQRLFTVDAQGGLRASQAGDARALEASGVPGLARELSRLCASRQHLASQGAKACAVLRTAVRDGILYVSDRKKVLDHGIVEALAQVQREQYARLSADRTRVQNTYERLLEIRSALDEASESPAPRDQDDGVTADPAGTDPSRPPQTTGAAPPEPPDPGARPPRRLKAFLCHSSGDKTAVRELYRRLHADDIDAWLDEENILAGQDWQLEIRKAVRSSDVVLVCLSERATTKAGYLHREIRFALDLAEEQPEGTIFIIPVRLEPCDPPEHLASKHWVNLFDEGGYERLMRSLRARSKELGIGC